MKSRSSKIEKKDLIDLHCHILAAIDDGPESLEESLSMCEAAAADGITTIVATPHIGQRGYHPKPAAIQGAVDQLNAAVAQKGLPLNIVAGAEYALQPDLFADPSQIVTINSSGRYVLIELPTTHVPAFLKECLFRLQLLGLKPVLAHPERHHVFQNEPDLLFELVAADVLLQITAASLLGGFGRPAFDTAQRLLKAGAVHIIASDAHSQTHRPPVLSKAVEKAAEILGSKEAAMRCVREVPAALLNGEPVARFPELTKEATPPPPQSLWQRLFQRFAG